MIIHFSTLHSCQFSESLGMADDAISDVQISASSQKDASHAASQGRLKKAGSWSPDENDVSPWLEIDLGDHCTRVTDVATQGGYADGNWVTRYKLQYSDDGLMFRDYREQGLCAYKVRKNCFAEW